MEDGGGSVIVDKIGSKNLGTAQAYNWSNTEGFTPVSGSYALQLGTSAAFGVTTSGSTLIVPDEYTFSFYVQSYAYVNGAGRPCMQMGSFTVGLFIRHELPGSNQCRWILNDNNGAISTLYTANAGSGLNPYTDGWVNVVARRTLSGSTYTTDFFLNGTLVSSGSTTTPPATTNWLLSLGPTSGGGTTRQYFDEVKHFQRALSNSEIAGL